MLTKYTLNVISLRRYQNTGVGFHSPQVSSRILHSFLPTPHWVIEKVPSTGIDSVNIRRIK